MFQFISIIALFEKELSDFLRLRLINKGCNDVIQNIFFNLEVGDALYPRRSFIPIGKCWSCSARGNDVEQRVFMMDDPPRRTVVVCDRWKCRMIALFSKLEDIYIYDKFVYFYPSIEDNTYIIPRSNPKTKTMGKIAKNFNDIVIFRHEQYYVYVEWIEDKQTYRKLVPIKLFTAINNISQTFKIRSICQRLNVSNEDFKNNII